MEWSSWSFVIRYQFLVGTLTVLIDILLQNYFRSRGVGVFNQGVSFGILPGLGQEVAVIVYFIFIILYLKNIKSRKFSWELILLALGGLGNLLPRLFWGGVWDYLQVPLLPFWFNISDIMITAGLLSYILKGDGNSDIVRR